MKKIILTLFLLSTYNLHAGVTDPTVSDFISVAKTLVKEMELASDVFNPTVTAQIKTSIDETIIVSADQLLLDGVEKDAINYTLHKPYRIEVNKNRWSQYKEIKFKEKLVLHEYLFTLHIDDSDYAASEEIYSKIFYQRLIRSN